MTLGLCLVDFHWRTKREGKKSAQLHSSSSSINGRSTTTNESRRKESVVVGKGWNIGLERKMMTWTRYPHGWLRPTLASIWSRLPRQLADESWLLLLLCWSSLYFISHNKIAGRGASQGFYFFFDATILDILFPFYFIIFVDFTFY